MCALQSAETYVGMGGVGRLEAGLTLAMMARRHPA